MKIDKYNFEAYLLDLWEGNLSDDEKAELQSFLEKHPELDDGDALSLLEDISIAEDVQDTFDQDLVNFDDISEKNCEFFFIAYSENDLSSSEKEKVEEFVKKNPSYQKQFDQFQKAKLPAESLIYPDKEESIHFDEINDKNYEFFFIAYAEEDLSSSEKEMVEAFVKENPSYAKQFDQFQRAKLPEESLTFPDKESLVNFNHIDVSNYESYFIAYSEGDLSTSEKEMVERFIEKNPAYAKQLNQFKKAKLPLESVVYPNKKGLMAVSGSTPVISIQTRTWLMGVAAASIALFFWFNSSVQNVDNRYSMDGAVKIEIDNYANDPFEFNLAGKNLETVLNKNELQHNKLLAGTGIKTNISEKENLIDSNESSKSDNNEVKRNSISNIKANQLNNILASIDPGLSKKNDTEAGSNKAIKEEIPTILELTTAYLQRKNVLNNERKPDLKGILNNTLANVNENKEPVLATNENAGKKRTVFQLGDFKFERIAKK